MAAPPVIEISSSPAIPPRVAASSHRLQTVPASQAFLELQDGAISYLSTGLATLDFRLSHSSNDGTGGVERGKITEMWGPTGGGKTAIAFQTALSAIEGGGEVLWIDGAAELCSSRTKPVKPDDAAGNDLLSVEEILKNLKRLRAPTLSHLLAMIIHTPPDLITERTNLLIIDDLNILLAIDHPRQPFTSAAKTEQQKWQASRRYSILGSVVSALNKLAVLRNIAIIVTTGCSTRPRTESGLGLALVPGVGGTEWETGIWNRLIIFRDFSRRFVGIQKLQGKSQISREEVGETGRLIVFDVSSHGAVQEPLSNKSADDAITALAKARISPIRPRKRAFDEVADSDGEDVDEYGWADADDDAIAAEGLINDAPNADRPTEIN